MLFRSLAAAVLLGLAAAPSFGYIHFPPVKLPEMCKNSSNIRVLRVTKFDIEKGIIVYEVVESLKGESKIPKSFKHSIPKDTPGTKPIFDWVGKGKLALQFTIEWNGIACGYVFIDEFCYSVDYSTKGEYWLLFRVDPELAATYFGTAKMLESVAKDLLAGKDVKVPVKESVKPLTIKEREKTVQAINEIFLKNREK